MAGELNLATKRKSYALQTRQRMAQTIDALQDIKQTGGADESNTAARFPPRAARTDHKHLPVAVRFRLRKAILGRQVRSLHTRSES